MNWTGKFSQIWQPLFSKEITFSLNFKVSHTQKPHAHNTLKLLCDLKKIKKSNPYSQLLVNYYKEHALKISPWSLKPYSQGMESFFFFLKATERGVTLLFWIVIVKHHTREGERREHGNEKDNCADKWKQDIKNRVGTVRPHRTKAGASWEKFEQTYFEQI